MRIEALKYQTDKKEDIIIFVDYNEVYSEGYHVQWSIADIAYRRPPSRNYIFLSDTYRDDSEYYILSPCRLPRYLTKPRQRRSEWDMAGSDGISRVSAVFRGKSLLTNKMRII